MLFQRIQRTYSFNCCLISARIQLRSLLHRNHILPASVASPQVSRQHVAKLEPSSQRCASVSSKQRLELLRSCGKSYSRPVASVIALIDLPPPTYRIFGAINIVGGLITIFLTFETKGYDADVVDAQEKQEKAGYMSRVEA